MSVSSSSNVDERVVQMKFDNKEFESNAKDTMSTIDKLKDKLNFTSAGSGLESVGKKADAITFDVMSNGLDTVQMKFSTMEIVAITTLQNIVNSVESYVARIANSLTLEPVTDGFSEYELKMGSVQTIMASTGASLEEVNGYLAELNTYADKTIYSFSDMTNSIGKFTNAGVELDDAVAAIQGISNEAAVSGANANEASRAMYNFAQALSAGYVKLIDWKSIENANMATKEFKQELINTAVAVGTLTDAGDGMYQTLEGNTLNAVKNFNDTLQDGWMTTDVLVQTLNEYADETTDIGKKAFAAAQDVKTWTQLLDTLKEAVGSGWATTFETIIGDYNQAKEVFTGLSEAIGGLIDKISTVRNRWLTGVLSDTSRVMTTEYRDIYNDIMSITNDTLSMTDWQVVEQSGLVLEDTKQHIIDLAVAAGTLEKVSDGVYKAGEKTFTLADGFNSSLSEGWLRISYLDQGMEELATKLAKTDDSVVRLTGRQHLINGFVNIWNALCKVASAVSDAFHDIWPQRTTEVLYSALETFDSFTESLILSGKSAVNVKKIFRGFFSVIKLGLTVVKGVGSVVGSIIDMIAPGTDGLLSLLGVIGDTIYKAEQAIEKSKAFEKAIQRLKNLLSPATGAIRNAFSVISSGFKSFDSWISKTNAVEKAMSGVELAIGAVWLACKTGYNYISDFVKTITEIPEVAKTITAVKESFSDLSDYLSNNFSGMGSKLSEILSMDTVDDSSSSTGMTITEKLQAIWSTILTYVRQLDVSEMRSIITEKFSEIFPKNDDSTGSSILSTLSDVLVTVKEKFNDFLKKLNLFNDNGKDAAQSTNDFLTSITDAFDKFKSGASSFSDFVGTTLSSIFNFIFDNIGALVTLGTGGILAKAILSLCNAIDGIGDTLEAASDFINSFRKSLKNFAKGFKAAQLAAEFKALGGMFLSIAESIAILATAVATLSQIPNIEVGAGVVGELMIFMAGYIVLIKLMRTNLKDAGEISAMTLSFGVSILLLSQAVKTIGKLDDGQMEKGIYGLIGVMAAMAVLIAVCTAIPKSSTGTIAVTSGVIISVAASMIIMAQALKTIAKLDVSDAGSGGTGNKLLTAIAGLGACVAAMVLVIAACTMAANVPGAIQGIGMLISVSGSLLVMCIALKTISDIPLADIAASLGKLVLVISVLMLAVEAITVPAGFELAGVASLIAIAGSMLVFVLAIQMLSKLSLGQCLSAVWVLSQIIIAMQVILVSLFRFGSADTAKAALSFVGLGTALILISGSIMLLATVPVAQLVKAGIAIAAMAVVLGAALAISTLSDKAAGEHDFKSLIAFGVAIALFAVSIKILATVPWQELLLSVGSIVTLLASLAGAMVIVQYFKVQNKTIAKLTVMALIFAGLAALFSVIAQIGDATKTAELLAGISVAMVSAAVALAIIQKLPETAVLSALGPKLLAIVVVFGIFTAIGAALGKLNDLGLGTLLANAVDIFELLGECLGAIVSGFAQVVAIGLEAMVRAVVDPFIDLVDAVGDLQGSLKTLGGDFGENFENFVGALALLSAANIGSKLSTFIPGQDIVSRMKKYLPELADLLKSWQEDISSITDDNIKKIKLSAQALEALVEVANVIPNSGGLIGRIVGNNDIDDFGTMLESFGHSLCKYNASISGLTDDSVGKIQTSAEAAKALVGVAESIPNFGGLKAAFAGDNTLDKFGSQLALFGSCLVTYGRNISNLTDDDITAIENSADAVSGLVDVSNELDNTHGFFTIFTGHSDLTSFSTGIVALGGAMSSYADSVKTLDTYKIRQINASVDAVSGLAEVANAVPEDGGLWQKLTGVSSLTTFGDDLSALGDGLAAFASAIIDVDFTNVDAGVTAAQSLATLGDSVQSIVSAMQFIMGGDYPFDECCVKLADGLVAYAEDMATIEDPDAAKQGVTIASSVVGCLYRLSEIAWDAIDPDTFRAQMSSIAGGLYDFAFMCSLIDSDAVAAAETELTSVISMLSQMGSADLSGAQQAIDIAKEMSTVGVDSVAQFAQAFVDGTETGIEAVNSFLTTIFTDIENKVADEQPTMQESLQTMLVNAITKAMSQVKSTYSVVGRTLTASVGSGVRNGVSNATSACSYVLQAMCGTLRGGYSDMSSIGGFLMQGLALGISANAQQVYDQANAVATNAKNIIKTGTEVNSPSKFTIWIGKMLMAGLAVGLVAAMSSTMATVRNSTMTVMSALNDGLEAIDTDNLNLTLTITPVLDLSVVESQTAALDSMFGNRYINLTNGASESMEEQKLKQLAQLVLIGKQLVDISQQQRTISIDGKTTIGWVNRGLGSL